MFYPLQGHPTGHFTKGNCSWIVALLRLGVKSYMEHNMIVYLTYYFLFLYSFPSLFGQVKGAEIRGWVQENRVWVKIHLIATFNVCELSVCDGPGATLIVDGDGTTPRQGFQLIFIVHTHTKLEIGYEKK